MHIGSGRRSGFGALHPFRFGPADAALNCTLTSTDVTVEEDRRRRETKRAAVGIILLVAKVWVSGVCLTRPGTA